MPFAFALLVAAASPPLVTQNDAALVTELVTAALGTVEQLDVLSSADVKRQLELEADKRTLGCDSSASSCLAEIAGAMGAQLVVYGKLGTLGDLVILTLNLFDSSKGKAVNRAVIKGASLREVSERVDAAAQELVTPFASQLAPGVKAKVLVLDVEAPRGAPDDVAAKPTEEVQPQEKPFVPPSPILIGGVTGVGVGALIGAGSAVLFVLAANADSAADQISLSPADAKKQYDTRDAYTIGAIAGSMVSVATIAVAVAFVVMGVSE